MDKCKGCGQNETALCADCASKQTTPETTHIPGQFCYTRECETCRANDPTPETPQCRACDRFTPAGCVIHSYIGPKLNLLDSTDYETYNRYLRLARAIFQNPRTAQQYIAPLLAHTVAS
jgi:hypothetical protein